MIQQINDSVTDAKGTWWVVGGVNTALAAASLGVCVAMAISPETFLPDGVTGEAAARFTGAYVLARSVPLALATAWAVVHRSPQVLAILLVLLGIVQLCDVPIGVHYGNPAEAVVPLVLAGVHLLSAEWLRRHRGAGRGEVVAARKPARRV
jgi:hypothetical protein